MIGCLPRTTRGHPRTAHSLEWAAHSTESMAHSWEWTAYSKERMIHSLEPMAHSLEPMAHSLEWINYSALQAVLDPLERASRADPRRTRRSSGWSSLESSGGQRLMLRRNGTESLFPRRRGQDCNDGAATQERIAARNGLLCSFFLFCLNPVVRSVMTAV